MRIEICRSQPERFRQSSFFEFDWAECRFRLCHGDALGTAIFETDLYRQHTRASFLHYVHAAFLRGNHTELRKKEPRADDRVAGKFQLLTRGEDAQAGQRAFIGWLLYEDRFREIHFARNGLHLIVRKAVAVGEDREGIALKSRRSENVKRVKTVFHGIVSRGRSA